jgi:hypothetical protein
MKNILRVTLAASVAALTLASTPASAAAVGATTPATATAKIVKPLTLTASGALDFATILIPSGGVTATRTIKVSAGNVLDCAGGNAEVVCSGTTSVPTYNVKGTNKMVVNIIKTASSLTGSNGGTLAFRPTGQATATLPNSGNTGVDFQIGGDIDIVPATVDGTYSGNIDVTVDYP